MKRPRVVSGRAFKRSARWMVGWAGLALSLVGPTGVTAAGASPLTLPEVLASVEDSHPALEAALREVQRAQAGHLEASGGWDPRLAVESKWQPMGYYEHGSLDAKLRQATPLWGTELHLGYRLGRGDYPSYKGTYETLSAGEVRAGIHLPLWRNGPIDARRAAITSAQRMLEAARCGRDSARLEIDRQAGRTYWNWVAKGLEVRIQRQLLDVALARDAGLREQAALGSLPAIVVVDNDRLVLERRAKLAEATRTFQQASLALSLFLRDADMRPVLARDARLPPAIPELDMAGMGDEWKDIATALRQRPELCALSRKRGAAQVGIDLAENQRAPELNAEAFVARDVGAGLDRLRPTEFGAGLRFEMPLLLRSARGKLAAARADAKLLQARERGLRDRVVTEVRAARLDLRIAAQQVDLARQQVGAARALADAERERLAQGASDLVVVNLRELAVADAARLLVEARAAHHKAHVDYLAVIGTGLRTGQGGRPGR